MGRRVVKGKKDVDKDRAELIAELNDLRDVNSRLKDVVKRYEKVAGKKDLFRSLYDLEAGKDSVESLRNELQEKQQEADQLGEELAVQNEELRVRLEEINTHSDELVRISEALRESEARLRLAQHVARIGTFEWNIQTGVNTWTPELEAMYGLPTGVFPGTQEAWEQLVYPADRPDAVRRVNEAMEKGGFEGEWRVVWPDGTVHWLHGRGFIFKDESGKPLKLVGINIDITERKQLEDALRRSRDDLEIRVEERTEELRESEEMIWNIFDSSPVPMVLYNESKGRYNYNNSFTETFGYTIEDIPSINEWWLLAYPDEKYREYVKKRWYAAVDKAVENRTSIEPQEAVITCKDGSKKDIIGNFSSIGNLNLVVFYDITERKRAEEELQDAKARAELYLDLMGHDINNMHQIAIGYLELALNMPVDARQDEVLEKPIEVLQRSARLIKNVRKLQRISDGMYQTQEVDVCKMLMDIQREFGAVPHKAISLNLNGCERCHVRANELLYDVFANLVTNAIKHTEDNADIDISLDAVNDNGGQYCQVIIEDNGPGIPDDNKGIIFNRTLKGPSKTKGMGLGLYLVKSLVESYGGRVWVEDRVKGDHTKGAQFVVMLPAAE